MKKILFYWICLLLTVTLLPEAVSAQYQNTTGESQRQKQSQGKKQPVAKRWFAGGMLGGGFSSYNSYVQVAPVLGYKVTPKFHVGTRLNYIYESYKDPSTGVRYNLHIYGGSLFGRYLFYRSFFAHVEYEVLSVPVYPYEGGRRSVNSFFVGVGIIQNLGGSGFSTITVLYNLNDNIDSPYSNPLIRVGFGIGF